MILGYARVSTQEQNLIRQLDQLAATGCEKIFQEKITGAKVDRPELARMLDQLREGDTVIVPELTRLSRSTKDLIELIEQIHAKNANIKSLKEPWMDTATPHGKLIFTFFAGISEFERELIRQRTREGLESARARGRKGGRPKKAGKRVEIALKMYHSRQYQISEILETSGISKATLYRYLKMNEEGGADHQKTQVNQAQTESHHQ